MVMAVVTSAVSEVAFQWVGLICIAQQVVAVLKVPMPSDCNVSMLCLVAGLLDVIGYQPTLA